MINFDKVGFGYNQQRMVLKDLTFHIKKSGITALLGPNGTGKTTMINLALGWLKPLEGSISVDGRDLNDFPRRELSRLVSLVPQQEVIPFHLQVLNFVLFGRTPYLKPLEIPGAKDVAKAREALKRLGISELENRYVNSLSGGEKHMVLLARSLAQEADCILMDEPTNHMDPANRLYILRTIRDLADSGCTIMFSTHHPELAMQIADETVCLKDGNVLFSGKSKEVICRENLKLLYGVESEIFKKGDRQLISWIL